VLGSNAAQPHLPVDWSVYSFESEGAPLLSPPQDTLPCPQCHPKKHFWVAASELMLAQLIPWSINGVVRNKEWAKIGPTSWEENFENPWVWDNNAFLNNQFSHPYQGNLYFNSARSNGYNFWASAPWSMAGSLMWEMFFEVWAPAPNDWLNTSFGGINLGEVTYRLSGLVLKNEATGGNRALRETGAFLIDPFRGFNRLIRGEMKGQSQTPPDWRPSLIQGSIDVGYRQASQSGQINGPATANQGIIDFTLWYGSLLRDIRSAPFSHFRLFGELAGNDTTGKLASLETRGTLGGKSIRDTENNLQVLGVMMNYDYISNPIVEYGAQSFSGGWISGWNAGTFKVQTQLLARATVIGATKSDYYDVQEGRNYDYGAGRWPRASRVRPSCGPGTLRSGRRRSMGRQGPTSSAPSWRKHEESSCTVSELAPGSNGTNHRASTTTFRTSLDTPTPSRSSRRGSCRAGSTTNEHRSQVRHGPPHARFARHCPSGAGRQPWARLLQR